MTRRIGFWVDLDNAYVTFHKSYVESVWWALSQLFEQGLLYQGYKVVWWWPQGGTALSAGEVGQGYLPTDDPSVMVRFSVVGHEKTSFLAWTTTPWTLPSNVALAVGANLDYVTVETGEGDEGAPDPRGGTRRQGAGRHRAHRGGASQGRRPGRHEVRLAVLVRRARGRPRARAGRRRLRVARGGIRLGPPRPRVRRRRLPRVPGEGPRLPAAAPARRHVPARGHRLRGALLQRSRQGHHPQPQGARPALQARGPPPRLPLLLAQDERPAHPVRAPRLVHPHHAGDPPRAGQQPAGELGAEPHQGRSLWSVPGRQRGLGAVARALLGHAAARVDQRRDRRHGVRRLGAPSSRRTRAPSTTSPLLATPTRRCRST
jgi:hypothetical protein